MNRYPANPDQETHRILEELSGQVDQLHTAVRVATDEYQYSEPITFGGLTTGAYAAYQLSSEFTTPSQYSVVLATFGGAGTLVVSQDPGAQAPALTGPIQPSLRFRGQLYAAAAASSVPGTDFWSDLPAGGAIYLAVNVTTDAGWVTVQFRRRVSRAGVYAEGHA